MRKLRDTGCLRAKRAPDPSCTRYTHTTTPAKAFPAKLGCCCYALVEEEAKLFCQGPPRGHKDASLMKLAPLFVLSLLLSFCGKTRSGSLFPRRRAQGANLCVLRITSLVEEEKGGGPRRNGARKRFGRSRKK